MKPLLHNIAVLMGALFSIILAICSASDVSGALVDLAPRQRNIGVQRERDLPPPLNSRYGIAVKVSEDGDATLFINEKSGGRFARTGEQVACAKRRQQVLAVPLEH